MTASEVYEAARRILPTISFATVYNSLRFLRDNGFICEIQFGNGASRYDALLERHDHALCVGCGKLVDLNLELPAELMNLAAKRADVEPRSIELTLKGVCADCRAQSAK